MTNWFTADSHFGHKNIIRHCNRPWKSVDKMNSDLIKNVNDLLSPGDTLYHIGDWCWFGPDRRQYHEALMSKYKDGIIHHLILGNHDRLAPFTYVDIGFTSVHTALWMTLNGHNIIMVHDPSAYDVVKNKGTLICGHIHGLFKKIKNTINVGVDVWDFNPVHEETIVDIIEGN